MNPLYFGSSKKPLFGVYYLPQNFSTRERAVVLCYPMGQEYLWMHRAYRQLSAMLSKNGFHVLRFDYYGCGDSSGNSDEGTLVQWLSDISSAIEELKDASGLDTVNLAGFRLGGTLAAKAAAQRKDVDSIVLWDPIVDGMTYLQELGARHKLWMENNLPHDAQAHSTNGTDEVIGFPLSKSVREELEALQISELDPPVSEKLLVVQIMQTALSNTVRQQFQRLSPACHFETISNSDGWIRNGEMNPLLIPGELFQTIVGWLDEVAQ